MGFDEKKPFLTKPVVATTADKVFKCAQSKYTTTPLNQILLKTAKYKSLVHTGLPHHIAAIRMLQQAKNPLVKNINITIGLFYGETIGFSALQSILNSYKAGKLENIAKIAYREGDWPGNFYIKLKNGKEINIRKFHANYLIPSHITKYSLYQVDFMNELADISVGDAWAPSYEKRGEGWSVVIARSDKGLELINKLIKEKKVILKEINYKELVNMHSHGLDLKKRGAFLRIEKLKNRSLPFPEYGYEPINIPARRRFFEIILGMLFKIFQNRIFIKFIEFIPPFLIGRLFVVIRNVWKSKTKSAKKGGLFDLKFTLTPTHPSENNFSSKEVKAFWDGVAEIYEKANKKVGYVHYQRFEKALHFVKPKPGQVILNLWSRTGSFIPYLRKIDNLKIVNREISPNMIKIAKSKFPKENFELTDLVKLKEFKDNSFDLIYSLETLEHSPRPYVLLKEFNRVLKPGGKLILSLPPGGFELPTKLYDKFFLNHGEGPHRFLWSDEVKKLIKASGLSLTKHQPYIMFPMSSEVLTRLNENLLTGLFSKTPLANFGVRHFYIANKWL